MTTSRFNPASRTAAFRLATCTALALSLLWLCHPAAGHAQAGQHRDAQVARARQLFEEGIAAYNAGSLHQALERMKGAHALLRRPEFAFNIARVLERLGEAEHAISWFRVYLRHGQPSDTERSDIDARISALEEYRDRVEGQAIATTPSGDAMTQESQTFFNNGVAMFQRGQYQAAMQAFQYAERFRPFPELYYNMALTAEQLRDNANAALYYEEYLDGRPNAPGRVEIEQKIRELEGRR